MGNYNDLKVWREAIALAVEIYEATTKLPSDETFGLKLQMRKAAVSIPSNIAEGQGRHTDKDYRRFLINARGSLFELETQIEICRRLEYVDTAIASELRKRTGAVAKPLNGLLHYLDRKTARSSAQPDA